MSAGSPSSSGGSMMEFPTGATRSNDSAKPDYEGFISPFVVRRFGEYMNHHRTQLDGAIRASDNWQKGMDQPRYIRSLWRHFLDLLILWRGGTTYDDLGKELTLEDVLCALYFNVQGLLHETLKARGYYGMEDTDEAR